MAAIGKTRLDSGWIETRDKEVTVSGTQLTTTHPPSPALPWMEAVVPGTVMATLVKGKDVPDPFYELQNDYIIDITESGRQYYTFWLFTTFQCKLSSTQFLDLNFRAINYYAEVYLNGHKKDLPRGMFRRHSLDVTDIEHPDGRNLLAVRVYPPDNPGTIPPEGGQGGDHEIGKDVAAQYGDCGYGESDLWSQLFGFRKIESHIDTTTGGRLFKVNGQPIFIRGGNWTVSDGLLRLSKECYRTDIKFHADMNLNMLRCWGGGVAERPEFYHYLIFMACWFYWGRRAVEQRVWQEFWITGDVNGRGVPVSNPNGPLDHDLFLLCARDTVKLLRNHPSLALWVGGSKQIPPDDINTALKHDLRLHPYFESSSNESGKIVKDFSAGSEDPSQYLDGARIYIQGSLWDGFANGKGDFTDGLYEIQNPEDFFKDDFYKYGFNPEVGSVGMPVSATIRATMPPEARQIPLFKKVSNDYEEVPNGMWVHYKYIPYSKPGKVHDQILLYGSPKDLDDFCLKAQLANYIQYKALLEGWTSRMWSKYTGVLIWKTQNPWPGLRGQLYDHFLDQTAGFYGCRCAAEPIHVQLNLATYFIEELSDVAIEASVWDLEGTCPYYIAHEKVSKPPKRTVPIAEMKYPKSKNPRPVYFLLHKLYHMSDYRIISRNFYWLHLSGGDYKLLEPYRKKTVPLKVTSQVSIKGTTYEMHMRIQNKSKKPVPKSLTYQNNFTTKQGDGDFDVASVESTHDGADRELEVGWFRKISRHFTKENGGLRVAEINGNDTGVAFFLHFSVHGLKTDHKEGEDTKILRVHYSDNYFSLVPGEAMPIKISFEVPPGVTPRVTLDGWNYHGVHTVR
ncbi:mannosylglycoprotein endo-beta-mannosidase [Prunus yedoensis var. nudiflora]|uniref:Mannosylglycoprotein endo-beta-mannosidase n=1 Tax=Prunus yedoensis var. nudiflora TaxID=2094558 RepID=A0A314YP99_PRUYE|nr:mannosylglycoprotein endo-beta-mannosidase [Prunus yedoensis var. nudiflora]